MTALITTQVRATYTYPDGSPVVGAKVVANLSKYENDNGLVVPTSITSLTNENGEATLNLWPNTRGVGGSTYSIYISKDNKTIWSGTVAVPELETVVDVHTILQTAATPTLDAAQIAVLQAQEYAAQAAASAEAAALSSGGGGGSGVDIASVKDISNGIAGLSLFKINLLNALGTIKSFITTIATAPRTYTFPDKDITVAGLSDITGTNSGVNTGDETAATIKTKLGITTISGDNTGDETTSSIKTKLGITTLSGSNTGDETSASIKSKLGVTVLSGSNTGDQTLTSLGIPNVENKSSADIRAEISSANVTSALGYTPLSNASTTDNISEGTTNQYFTVARVRNAVLTGLSTTVNAVITGTDTVLSAFGKIQKQITDHLSDTNNPHSVTKAQVGLGNVDNTSDANKPVSTAQAAADTATLNAAKAYADGISGAASGVDDAIVDGVTARAPSQNAVYDALITKQDVSGKDASGGYVGLTAFKVNLRNATNTVTSWLTNSNTVARTYTLPDKDGTIATLSDITGTNSGVNTGDQTLTSLGIPNVENKSSATIRSEITSGNVTTALGYTPLSNSATTDAVTEGSTNLYHTAARVRSVVLTGLSTATNAVIDATDSILSALGKLQKQVTDHSANTSNPHSVTKTQVGLGNVDNTSDASKPISTATQTALDAKAGLAANTFTGAQVHSDQQVSRAMLIDCGNVFLDKGNSGTTTQTLDYTAGSHQKITVTGSHTIALSNWPPSGNLGQMLLELVNGGAFTVTWPTINWIKSTDGTTTTTFASNGVTLQSSGTDWVFLWTRDGGTTIYGKIVR